jgi:hypothetical protein
MRINKVVRKTIVRGPGNGAAGANLAAGISAVVSANAGDSKGSNSNQVSSRQDVRIVQRGSGASHRPESDRQPNSTKEEDRR